MKHLLYFVVFVSIVEKFPDFLSTDLFVENIW